MSPDVSGFRRTLSHINVFRRILSHISVFRRTLSNISVFRRTLSHISAFRRQNFSRDCIFGAKHYIFAVSISINKQKNFSFNFECIFYAVEIAEKWSHEKNDVLLYT